MSVPTIYEYAGRASAFHCLTGDFYARVSKDPLLASLFSHFTDEHVGDVAQTQ